MADSAHIFTLMNYFSLPFGEVRGSAPFLGNNGAAPTCYLSAGGGRISRRKENRLFKLTALLKIQLFVYKGSWIKLENYYLCFRTAPS